MKIIVPLRTVSGLNVREHHMARARRVKMERESVGWILATESRPLVPCTVVLTRIAPSSGLDQGDNLAASLKGVRDAVAAWIGIDDRHAEIVDYRYAQERGPWAVAIEITCMPKIASLPQKPTRP